MSEDLKAPRYRLVGYDIGTAPDENGGWVHWTDHEAIVARLTARAVKAEAYAAVDRKMATKTAEDAVAWKARAEKAEAERDAALADAVKVKPLVWADFHDRGAKAQAWNEANYMIQKWIDGRWEISASYPGYSTSIYGTDRFYPTIEAAKGAAQADYEASARAALQPDPDARQADLAKAWTMGRDAAANEAHGFWIDSADLTVELSDYIHALTPPAELAAKIGGE
jgi:hypothetical protein